MQLLYIPLKRSERICGMVLLSALVLSSRILPDTAAALTIYHGFFFLTSVFVFLRFLTESARIPLTPVSSVVKFALLGLILAQLANLLTNDLIYFFLPQHFDYGDTGPYFMNVRKELIGFCATENFPLTALSTILFAPVWEELLHRGLVFGTLVKKNIPLAYVTSIILYALLAVVPLLGISPTDYVVLSFIQYIPMSLVFCWIYTKSETILTPILAHMIMNAVSIFTLR